MMPSIFLVVLLLSSANAQLFGGTPTSTAPTVSPAPSGLLRAGVQTMSIETDTVATSSPTASPSPSPKLASAVNTMALGDQFAATASPTAAVTTAATSPGVATMSLGDTATASPTAASTVAATSTGVKTMALGDQIEASASPTVSPAPTDSTGAGADRGAEGPNAVQTASSGSKIAMNTLCSVVGVIGASYVLFA